MPSSKRGLSIAMVKTSILLGVAYLVASCQTAPVEIPATDAHRNLFAGTYRTYLSGGTEVSMVITRDLAFEFDQPIAADKMKKLKGTLRVTGDRTARAERVRLEWIGRSRLNVKTPYGTTMSSGGSAGAAQGQWGQEFMLSRN